MSYGLGWVVQDYRGRLVLSHVGLIDGFRAHVAVLPKDGYALAILANRQGTRMNLALGNSLIDLLLGLPEKDWNKHLLDVTADEEADARVRARRIDEGRRPEQAPSVSLDGLAGQYEHPAYGTATVRTTPDGLIWEWGAWKLPLEHYAGDTYRLKSDGPPLDRAFFRFHIQDASVRDFRLLGITFQRKR